MKIKRIERYATLLRVRKRQEDLKVQAFAQAQRVVRDLETERDELFAYQRRVLEEAGRQAVEPVAGRLEALYRFDRHLGKLADEKDAKIVAQQGEVDDRRRELDDAIKQRRIIERLIEIAELEAKEEFNRQDRRLQDEFASIQFARNRMNDRRLAKMEPNGEDNWNSRPGDRLLLGGSSHPAGDHGQP